MYKTVSSLQTRPKSQPVSKNSVKFGRVVSDVSGHRQTDILIYTVVVLRLDQGAQAPQILPRTPNFFQGNLGLTFPHVNRLR